MGVPDTLENRARFTETTPFGRLAEPSDVAGASTWRLTWLSSSPASCSE